MLKVEDMNMLMVGGGKVALSKAKKFLEYGAFLKVLSPQFQSEFYVLKNVELIRTVYNNKYIEHCTFVVAATDDVNLNQEIYKDCKAMGVLCCNVTDGQSSDFILPASFRQGDLTLAVSTNGKSPSLSKGIVGELKEVYDESWERKVKLLGEIRGLVLKMDSFEGEKKAVLKEMIQWDEKTLELYLKQLKGFEIQ
jgi:precorrin-2 dehydrogenase/sirohydrochlorin ferrochelatase